MNQLYLFSKLFYRGGHIRHTENLEAIKISRGFYSVYERPLLSESIIDCRPLKIDAIIRMLDSGLWEIPNI